MFLRSYTEQGYIVLKYEIILKIDQLTPFIHFLLSDPQYAKLPLDSISCSFFRDFSHIFGTDSFLWIDIIWHTIRTEEIKYGQRVIKL